jgi:hypothetical protein
MLSSVDSRYQTAVGDTRRRRVAPSIISLGSMPVAGAQLLSLTRHKRSQCCGLLSLCLLMLPVLMGVPGCNSSKHSSPVSQTTRAATTTVLSVNSAMPVEGTPTVFTAQVKPISENGVPTGAVTFSAGTARLGVSRVTDGSATFTTTSLPLGSQAVIATYSGDSAYDTSSSAVTLLNVSSNIGPK